ncbi:MAG TPA: ABC transporter substrate-binding protein [Burkholderiaceae bacterium]|nr:ABC transporter substrate-binding protein [Burkholderiaceae bacterium]
MDRRVAMAAILMIGSAPRQPMAQALLPRVTVLLSGTATSDAARADTFGRALRDLGYSQGQNIAVEYTYANGDVDRLDPLAAQVVSKVDVVVAAGSTASRAVRKASASIPIVMVFSGDPVAAGLVESLAHPGGNTTGLSLQATDLGAKQLEFLKRIVPRLSSVAVIGYSQAPSYRARMQEIDRASSVLGLRILRIAVHDGAVINEAFAAIQRSRAGAVLVLQSPPVVALQSQIAEFGLTARLPTMYIDSEFTDLGGLASYGPDYAEMFKRSATYVDKILRGVKPRDLPVEQVERFELVINLKTAKRIGLQIPAAVLLQADRVIE